jgi:hypothetical protein
MSNITQNFKTEDSWNRDMDALQRENAAQRAEIEGLRAKYQNLVARKAAQQALAMPEPPRGVGGVSRRVSQIVKIDLIQGVEGFALYIDKYRVAGPKPWGGGTSIHSFEVRRNDMIIALWGKPDE